MIGLRPTNRSAKLGVGVKDISTGKVSWVNLDNQRVLRDFARHSTLGQWVQVGPQRYQQDTAQIGGGGAVSPRTGSLTLDIAAGALTYVAGSDSVYTKGNTASWAALTQAVTPNATNPLVAAIGLNTSTPGTPAAAVLAGTAAALVTEERFVNGSSTLPSANFPAVDQTADRAWLALVWVPPSITTLTSVASTDVFTTGSAHGYKVNDPVWFSGLTGGAGLTANQVYYVNSVPSTTTFTVSATLGGSNFDHTTNITAGTVQRQILAADVIDIRP
jgi:hypothetical protein